MNTETTRLINIISSVQTIEQSNAAMIEVVKVLEKNENYAKEAKSYAVAVKRQVMEEEPINGAEADEIRSRIRKKGVEVLGGKRARAYKNSSLRGRVYSDIYGEVKRNFGLTAESGKRQSYLFLKRKHYKTALTLIDEYVPPIALYDEIDSENIVDVE